MNKVCVLGLGYIGLPTASVLATHGFKVIGVDVNEEVIGRLKNGEPGNSTTGSCFSRVGSPKSGPWGVR